MPDTKQLQSIEQSRAHHTDLSKCNMFKAGNSYFSLQNSSFFQYFLNCPFIYQNLFHSYETESRKTQESP